MTRGPSLPCDMAHVPVEGRPGIASVSRHPEAVEPLRAPFAGFEGFDGLDAFDGAA